jgi:hypothetical protein
LIVVSTTAAEEELVIAAQPVILSPLTRVPLRTNIQEWSLT